MAHHYLPHYRGEFDRVGSDIVEWIPYMHLHESDDEDVDRDEDVSWDDYGPYYARGVGVALVHFEVVK